MRGIDLAEDRGGEKALRVGVLNATPTGRGWFGDPSYPSYPGYASDLRRDSSCSQRAKAVAISDSMRADSV